jgi:hypothetical protein
MQTVMVLSGDNRLLNADEGIMSVGATLTPDVGDRILAPGETVVDLSLACTLRRGLRSWSTCSGNRCAEPPAGSAGDTQRQGRHAPRRVWSSGVQP